MIIYDLGCGEGHRFEGWFASADDFARQSAGGLVGCPVCGSDEVAIVPSAKVAVSRDTPAVRAESAAQESATGASGGGNAMLSGLTPEALRKLREIVHATENVGARFPEEARRIHYDEVPARPIRGQASPDEAQALRDEGIEFAALPAFLTRDSH
jgi:hypothetical protein